MLDDNMNKGPQGGLYSQGIARKTRWGRDAGVTPAMGQGSICLESHPGSQPRCVRDSDELVPHCHSSPSVEVIRATCRSMDHAGISTRPQEGTELAMRWPSEASIPATPGISR